MSNANRLLKNSFFLYLRMLILMGIGFFTTRKILEALGVVDLGIYNVVGSLVLMFDFVSSGLTNSTQRFINIGLGKNNLKLTNQYFSQSLIVHVGLALAIVAITEPIGMLLIQHRLLIPVERLHAAIVIYHISLASLFVRLVKICFESDVIARERMSIYAYLGLFEGVAKLVICYVIIANECLDKLILYGCLLLLINVSVAVFNIIYCLAKYPESHFKFYHEKRVFKELLSFVGINSFGVISWALGKQGINVVMNMFFGPVVNGAKGVASNLERVVAQFASNVDVALRPQITKLYAQNDSAGMCNMAMKSTKYIFFVILFVSTPFLFETKGILSIWLKEVPQYTEVFVQILMFEQMANALNTAFIDMSLATGKIKNVQIRGRLITLSGLPLTFVALKLLQNPYLPLIMMASLTFAYSFYVVIEMNRFLNFGIIEFVKKVLLPIFVVCLVSFSCCRLLQFIIPECENPVFVCLKCALYCGVTLGVSLCGIEKNDRLYILQIVKSKVKKH